MTLKYIILAIYFGILFLIGILASRKIKGLKDFYVGGKNLGYWVVAFSARATGESAWLLLGLTGMGAVIGVKAFWVVAGEMLGVVVAWFFMAKPFKRLTDGYDSITIPDYLESRFPGNSRLIRIISATTLAIFVVIYVSAQIDATGAAFETFLQWDYYVGALAGFAIVTAYIFIGGFVAVAWSDLFQGLLMLAGLLALPIVGYFMFKGDSLITTLHGMDPSLLHPAGAEGWTFMSVLSILGLSLIGLGFMGSPQVFVRFISIRSEDEIRKGRWVAFFFTLLTDCAAVFVGIVGRALLTGGDTGPEVLGNGGQDVLPMMVDAVMPAALAGLYVAIVLAAIMSTIDSLLVVASSAVVRDFYQKIMRPELKEEDLAGVSRWVTIALAIFALGIAMTVAVLTPSRTIFWFVIFGWSGISATFAPMMILSLFYKKYNAKGAITSMVTGFLSVPFFKFVVPEIPGIGPYFEQLAELPPSFFLAMLLGVIVTEITAQRTGSLPD